MSVSLSSSKVKFDTVSSPKADAFYDVITNASSFSYSKLQLEVITYSNPSSQLFLYVPDDLYT